MTDRIRICRFCQIQKKTRSFHHLSDRVKRSVFLHAQGASIATGKAARQDRFCSFVSFSRFSRAMLSISLIRFSWFTRAAPGS